MWEQELRQKFFDFDSFLIEDKPGIKSTEEREF